MYLSSKHANNVCEVYEPRIRSQSQMYSFQGSQRRSRRVMCCVSFGYTDGERQAEVAAEVGSNCMFVLFETSIILQTC